MDTPPVPTILEVLIAALERPREITAQVRNHLTGTYGLTREALGPFLDRELPKLEDYEIDLILSPLFTPTLDDQSPFAERLGVAAVPVAEWPGLIARLVSRPTRAPLVTEDGQTHLVALRVVTVERFVHRLRLDATIPEPLFKLLVTHPSAADRPRLKAIARRAIWSREARREILIRYLLNSSTAGPHAAGDDAVALLKVMETYEPADRGELLAQIPHWQQVLRQEINTGPGAGRFFNERVEAMHGGGRDQRRQDTGRRHAQEDELAFLERLQRLLAD